MVEARGRHLAQTRRLHLRDFLGPLVHEQDEDAAVRTVLRDSFGDGLQDHRLSRLRGRHDEGALTRPHGTDEVDDAVRVVGLATAFESAFETQPAIRVLRAQAVEPSSVSQSPRGLAVDGVEVSERGALAGAWRSAGLPADLVTGPEVVPGDDLRAYVDVLVARRISRVLSTHETGSVAKPLEQPQIRVPGTFGHLGRRWFSLRWRRPAALASPSPRASATVAVPATAAASRPFAGTLSARRPALRPPTAGSLSLAGTAAPLGSVSSAVGCVVRQFTALRSRVSPRTPDGILEPRSSPGRNELSGTGDVDQKIDREADRNHEEVSRGSSPSRTL